MSIELHWLDDQKTILLLQFPKVWEWEDYDNLIDQLIELHKDLPHTFDRIVDLSACDTLPDGSAAESIYRGRVKSRSLEGIAVMVGAKDIFKSFFSIMDSLHRRAQHATHYVETVSEAVEIIKQNNQSASQA